jgi:hypothetical protein
MFHVQGALLFTISRHALLTPLWLQMVWDECHNFHEAKGVLASFTHGAAWRGFEELVAHNLAYWVSPSAEASGREMRFVGASLAVAPADVAAALQQHPHCPVQLHNFHAQPA